MTSSMPFAGASRHVRQTIARVTDAVVPADLLAAIRLEREWRGWVESISAAAVAEGPKAAEEARELFRRHVTLVELETHARCNRVCSFCPNVRQDRRRETTRTDADMLRRVFEQLGSIGYARQIKVARYSEPLSDVDYLLEQLAVARALVPHAELAVVTNSDYLTRERLEALADAGLDRLYMSLYLRRDEAWTPAVAHRYLSDTYARLGLPRPSLRTTSTAVEAADSTHRSVRLFAACRNFDVYGTDRGALMTQFSGDERRSPCREPFETFVIDYTGAVMPCCNLRSDMPEHRGFAVADLLDARVSIFEVYAERLARWRRSMVGFSAKAHPCETCQHRVVPSRSRAATERALARRLDAIGEADLA